MPQHTTAFINNEAGVQYTGPRNGNTPVAVFPFVGMLYGRFRRGRFDKPMTINLRNVKALLGDDPQNPDFIAVMDALESGIPSIQVLRIGDSGPLFCIKTPESYYFAFQVICNNYQEMQIFERTIEVTIDGNKVNRNSVSLYMDFGEHGNMVALGLYEEFEPYSEVIICAGVEFQIEMIPM